MFFLGCRDYNNKYCNRYANEIQFPNNLRSKQYSRILNKSLEKVWETPNQLKDPESVDYDSSKSTLYLSNVDGKPDDKDHTGFISKPSSTNGTIIDSNWVPNLNAPKGTYLDNNTGRLYVSDIT